MRKKCIFLLLPQMDYGGQEKFAARLTYILKDTYDVKLIIYGEKGPQNKVYCDVLSLNCPVFQNNLLDKIRVTIRRVYKLKKLFKQYKPSVCISFGVSANISNLLAKQKGIKSIASIRGYATVEHIADNKIIKLLYHRADKIICVSNGIKNKMCDIFPKLKEKIVVLYNAYDCSSIYKDSKNYSGFKSKSSFTPGESLVSVGTIKPEKGFWHLIKAVSILKREFPNIKLSIIGENNEQNEEKLLKLAKELKLEQNVLFEGHHINPYPFISKADVYILSSIREGFPNALVEAMACGKPVVAADCLTGPREILSDKQYELMNCIGLEDHGILVPRLSDKENYNAQEIEKEEKYLAEGIAVLLRDSKMRYDYGLKAKKRAEYFSYQQCYSNIVKIIEG